MGVRREDSLAVVATGGAGNGERRRWAWMAATCGLQSYGDAWAWCCGGGPECQQQSSALAAAEAREGDEDWTDDDADDSATQFSTGPSMKTPPSPAQD